jgi:ComF family protein
LKINESILSPLIHIFYPHTCLGCGSDIIGKENLLCLQCINDLPHTYFASHANNPIEKIFWGRIPVQAAMSEFYFSKESIIQNIIHQFKYHGNREAGVYLGRFIGQSLKNTNRFLNIDFLVPVPLFAQKEFKRGFNQSALLCAGINEVTHTPVMAKNVIRIIPTETQTKKGRIKRWENVEKSFHVSEPDQLEGKHILLVDDVITTGATLEACAGEILKVKGIKISIATLSVATS